jgi:hypothetical protein
MKDGYYITWIGFFLVVMGLALKQLDKQSTEKQDKIQELIGRVDSLTKVIHIDPCTEGPVVERIITLPNPDTVYLIKSFEGSGKWRDTCIKDTIKYILK